MKKLIAFIMTLVIALTMAAPANEKKAEAAGLSIYINVNDFAKALAKEVGLKEAEDSTSFGYIISLMNVGIMKDREFNNFAANITRGDMLVLLNRADEYLNGNKIDDELVQTVIEKRISDIGKVADEKKENVAKGFIKGFMKGYSNGNYSTDRNLKLSSKAGRKGALACIKMLKNKSLRAKISPDGQLIRTTNLPNNAYMYPYILASYPNRYYEGELWFEGVEHRVGGKIVPLKSPEDYTYPKDVAKAKVYGIEDFNVTKKKYMDMWLDKVYTRVWNTFNVNYKTIDKNWEDTIAQTDTFNTKYSSKLLYEFLDQYVNEMKENKTIVECDKISMDSSSIYFYGGLYYVRCYVHYRIVSTKTKTSYTADELDGKWWGPYNKVLFNRSGFVDIKNYKINKWVDAIFDIGLCTSVYGDDGATYGVCDCEWRPSLFSVIERK